MKNGYILLLRRCTRQSYARRRVSCQRIGTGTKTQQEWLVCAAMRKKHVLVHRKSLLKIFLYSFVRHPTTRRVFLAQSPFSSSSFAICGWLWPCVSVSMMIVSESCYTTQCAILDYVHCRPHPHPTLCPTSSTSSLGLFSVLSVPSVRWDVYFPYLFRNNNRAPTTQLPQTYFRRPQPPTPNNATPSFGWTLFGCGCDMMLGSVGLIWPQRPCLDHLILQF